ncbi:MAG: hypothetical protein IJW22_08400 [Clostridia bacterium]|nr:hypothetical protein [Clostridia bacterium]
MSKEVNHSRGMDPVERGIRTNFLRRTAKEAREYRVRMRILTAALATMVLLTSIFFIISALYNRSGSFTVKVGKVDMTKYGLSLSETPDMAYKTSQLNMNINEAITNIDGTTIPDDVDSINGEHNGLHYIAYTFYLENAGEIECSTEYTVDMTGISNGLDDAIRLKLYVDGEPTTYAKAKNDGSGPEEGTTAFVSSTVMARGRFDAMQPGEIHKFTVVIWIEGNDPECVDWLIGGQMKIGMNFEIIH